MTTDAPVLPNVAAGDSAAVSQCLDRYGNLVWSLARRSCPDLESAEDAVQEIFLKLWTVAERFDPAIASEPTFVAMIARRWLIDLSRKRKLDSSSAVELDHFSDREMSPQDRLELQDEAAKALQLLRQLPEDQQQVIRLSVYDGLSHGKISEVMGLSLGTVKTHIRRGMLKLRKSLFAQAPELALADPSNVDGGSARE